MWGRIDCFAEPDGIESPETVERSGIDCKHILELSATMPTQSMLRPRYSGVELSFHQHEILQGLEPGSGESRLFCRS